MRSLLRAAAIAAALLWSCSISPSGDLRVDSVEPSWGWIGEETEVVVSGAGFAPETARDVGCGGDPLTLDDGFDGRVGEEDLLDVEWVADTELRARVPGTLPVGTYDLELVAPSGETVVVPDAFEVIDPTGTDADTDSDSDSDTDGGDGVDCDSAVLVTSLPYTWTGAWADFYSSFAPENECGTGSSDVWFAVQLPADGVTLRVSEISGTDVLVRRVTSCTDWSCIDWVDEPELLEIPGGAGSVVYVVVTEIDGDSHPEGTVVFELL